MLFLMKNQKLINAAKNWDTIVKFFGTFMKVMGIIFSVFALLVLIFGEKMYEAGSISLDFDFIKLYLAEEYQTVNGLMKIHTIIGLLVGSLISFAIYYASKLLRNILNSMKEGRPFEADIPANLQKLAWTVLIVGAITQIAGIIERVILTKAYPIEQILSSSAIAKIEYSYTIDFNFIFITCILLFLSHIFAYGQELQKESDETL